MIAWIERRLGAAGDDEETRHRKVQFVSACILVMPTGLFWGAVYLAYGERAAAAIPIDFSIVTLVHLFILFRLRHYEQFRWTQQVMMFVLPIALQLTLGGIVGSAW